MEVFKNHLEKLLVALFVTFFVDAAFPFQLGRIHKVGPGRALERPSDAAKIANDFDTIEIDPAAYIDDVAIWRQNHLTIRGVNGRAQLFANNVNAEGKGIWVVKGNNTTIENIAFFNVSVPDRNGAGIRLEGRNLVLRNCYFENNENGILAGDNPDSEIIIEQCEFYNNGYGDGYTHNIYIGRIKKFVMKFCYVHHARIGHNVKSRAQENYILYNRIMDEEEGRSSYLLDLSNGGFAIILGNLMQQGKLAENSTLISYGAEGLNYTRNELYVVNNTIVNDRQYGKFFYINGSSGIVLLQNNLFVGNAILNIETPNLVLKRNILTQSPNFVNKSQYNYRLAQGSPAIDAGSDSSLSGPIKLLPEWQYVHPLNYERRVKVGKIDVGAYEFVPISRIGGHPGQPNQVYAIRSFPNPFSQNVSLLFYSSNGRPISFKLFDVSGRLIAKRSISPLHVGENILTFTVTELFGGSIANGTYYLVLSDGVQNSSLRLLFLK